jgi:hypothetical protein
VKAEAQPSWRRVEAGSYRSSDDRFELRSEGSGRWFVVDQAEHDELGLPRTEGPFSTLDAAKDAAAARRERPPAASPLADRIAEAGRHPARSSANPPTPKAAGTPRTDEATAPARPRTWLEELEDRDAAAGETARRLIAALIREGETDEDAAAVVRREVEAGAPAVAERRLARAASRVLDRAVDRRRLEKIAAGLSASDRAAGPEAIARAVAEEVVNELARVLDAGGRAEGLPGWQLVERPDGASAEVPAKRRGIRLRTGGA